MFLERFRQTEFEERKKRQRVHKRKRLEGPVVRSVSLSMPATAPSGSVLENLAASLSPQATVCRNFLIFSDDKTASGYFRSARAKRALLVDDVCAVTGRAAKYRDPVTGLPYANLGAFRLLRRAYLDHLQKHGDRHNPAVAKWLQSRA